MICLPDGLRQDSGNVTFEKRPLRPADIPVWCVLLNTIGFKVTASRVVYHKQLIAA
jgi:hypothetical protein